MVEERIDKWLWHARLARTRTQASRLVADGNFRINGKKTDKAHHAIREGDVLTFSHQDRVRVVRVLGVSSRRVGPELARRLYEEMATG